jgi:hypothetical protein
MKSTWFEVFIDRGEEEGTETIETMDTEEAAVQFAEAYQQASPHLSIHVDKWELDENGTPMPVLELF